MQSRTRRPNQKTKAIEQNRLVERWNAQCATGAAVRYWRNHQDKGNAVTAIPSRTRSEAWLLSGHTAVVNIEGVSGCVCLEHLEVIVAPVPAGDLFEARK